MEYMQLLKTYASMELKEFAKIDREMKFYLGFEEALKEVEETPDPKARQILTLEVYRLFDKPTDKLDFDEDVIKEFKQYRLTKEIWTKVLNALVKEDMDEAYKYTMEFHKELGLECPPKDVWVNSLIDNIKNTFNQ